MATSIRDATFVVTDTETTGTSPSSDRIIELAAVKVEGGAVVDRFQQLVNPRRSIPSRIAQMTGITTGMVFEAPPIEEVMPEYLSFLENDILTAHNLSFDRNFLNAELERMERDELDHEALCTLRLARRLLPGLKSKGLSRLVQFYDVDVNGRHRALGDARATATVLQRLLSKLNFEHGIDTLDELLRFQHRSYQSVQRIPKHLQRLREEVLPDVPDAPGVYCLKSSSGSQLYIGKAKRLANRVRSYFTAVESHGARHRKMMKKVRDVTWQTTPTELEAILLESKLIKEHKPRFNRAQRRYRSRPFVRLDTSQTYPRLGWTYHVIDDHAEYYGPLRGPDQADLVVEVANRFFRMRECDDTEFRLGQRCLYADMDRCTAPCETDDAETYAAEIDRVRAFLTGQDESVVADIRDRMEQASADLEFERAAEFRDWLETLEPILERQRVVGTSVRNHHAAVLYPERDDRVQIFLIRHGCLVDTHVLDPTDEQALRALETRIRDAFTFEQSDPRTYTKQEVDAMRLLVQWLRRHESEIWHLRWTRSEPPDSLFASVREKIRSLSPEAA